MIPSNSISLFRSTFILSKITVYYSYLHVTSWISHTEILFPDLLPFYWYWHVQYQKCPFLFRLARVSVMQTLYNGSNTAGKLA